MSYEVRKYYIDGNEICDDDCNNLEICILSKDSFGSINGWFDSQCKYLPKNFKSIRKKYIGQRDQTFIIYSQRTQNTNSAFLFVPKCIYLILFIILSKLI